jgi:hypothetical protein
LEDFRQWVALDPNSRTIKKLVWTEPFRFGRRSIKAFKAGASFLPELVGGNSHESANSKREAWSTQLSSACVAQLG